MNAGELRDAMIADLASAMRKRGFRRRGRSLVRVHPNGNRAVVSFQSSQRSTKERVYIRPACGISSFALHAAEWPDGKKKFVMEEHIGKLLSSFLPGIDPRTDYWWKISDADDRRLVFDELYDVLESKAVPWMDERWEDAKILEYLRSSLAKGLTGPQRTIFERHATLLDHIVSSDCSGTRSGNPD